VARQRPHGLPAADDGPAEARRAARRGEERAPAARRQRALRPRRRGHRRGALPRRAPVLVAGDRLDGRPVGRHARRRHPVLPHVLRAQQRHPRRRRRHPPRLGARARRALLRRHPARPGGPGAARPGTRAAGARHGARARGPGAAAALLLRLPHGALPRARRCGARRARLRARRRQERPPVPAAGLSGAGGAGGRRGAAVGAPRGPVHHRRHAQAGTVDGAPRRLGGRGDRPRRGRGRHAARAGPRQEHHPCPLSRPARERERQGRAAQPVQLLRRHARLRAARRSALRRGDRGRRAARRPPVPRAAQGGAHGGARGRRDLALGVRRAAPAEAPGKVRINVNRSSR
jgi:hypothetical protein